SSISVPAAARERAFARARATSAGSGGWLKILLLPFVNTNGERVGVRGQPRTRRCTLCCPLPVGAEEHYGERGISDQDNSRAAQAHTGWNHRSRSGRPSALTAPHA